MDTRKSAGQPGAAELGHGDWLAGQNRAFRAALNGASLAEALSILIDTAITAIGEGARGAFYRVSADGRTLHHVVGMPDSYAEKIDGFPIGAGSLSCGLAAATGRPVIIPDVREDPSCEDWRWLAEEYGYRSCWSFAVETVAGSCVGTFALYFVEPRHASHRDLQLAEALTGNAAIILGHYHEQHERERAEAALRESEQRFRALVTAGTYSIYRMSPDWRLMYQVDSSTLASTAEPIENWVEKYILEEDRDQVFAAIDQAIQTKSLFELEHRVHLADGSVGWVISRAVPLLGPDGEIVEWFGAGSNVTERWEAARKLREIEEQHRADLERQVRDRTAELHASRDLLRATMDSSIDMIQVFEAVRDDAGAIVDFRWLLNNHTSESRFGHISGQSLLERNPGVIEEGIYDTFKRVVETGVSDQSERHYVHEQFNGWFLQSVVKLGDGVATTTKDITDWKAAQAELLRLQEDVAEARIEQSERRLRQFGEASQDILWIRDADTLQWTYLTPAFEAIYGVSREEAMTGDNYGSWLDLVMPEDRARVREDVARVRRGEHVSFEYRIRRPSDGAIRWLRNTDFPIHDDSGEVRFIGGVGTDVTETKRAEQRRETLVAELQHRVRNILSVVRSVFFRTVATSQSVEDLSDHFRGRLDSLARTQVIVTQTETGTANLENLIREELLSVGWGSGAGVTLEGPEIELSPSSVEALALAIHELTTNSVKYGVLGSSTGELTIRWLIKLDYSAAPTLVLEWAEQGVPAMSINPIRTGFGTELLTEALPYRLGAKTDLEFRPGGIRCVIAVPLSSICDNAGDAGKVT